MAENFEELWNLQLSFNDKFFTKKLGKKTSELTLEEKVYWTKNQLLSIVKEAMEVLDEVPQWKEHRATDSEFVPSNLHEEVIDVNKFSIGLAQIWGMDYEGYCKEYRRKSYVVEQRWAQEHELKSIDKHSKVCAIDIDGVLGMYPFWFIEYCKTQGVAADTLYQIKTLLSPVRYEAMKSAYRQSGWKARMPSMPYASELTHYLRDKGYTIILLTARPYKEYSRIYPDTLEFLKNNNIIFDSIIWEKEKHLKILKEFPKMEFMIEDDGDNAHEVSELGYKVFLMPNEDDRSKLELMRGTGILSENITLIRSLKEVVNHLES